eukprot:GILI01007340.1.p1 GENE.GILI01007340.1~~GILI01007340.1.p1  ORF type:complete len:151 (+),score=31.05 GILI01007340.1:37-453(+)
MPSLLDAALGASIAIAAYFLMKDTTAGKSMAKDLKKADANLRVAGNDVKGALQPYTKSLSKSFSVLVSDIQKSKTGKQLKNLNIPKGAWIGAGAVAILSVALIAHRSAASRPAKIAPPRPVLPSSPLAISSPLLENTA